MQANGVIGIGRYTHWEKGNGHDGNGYSLRAYVEDTATDGLCAEVWLDFTTNPHEHHGPLLTYACGKKGWGIDPRHAESPKHNINGFRMAICRAKHPGQRFALRGLHNGDSRPMNCHEWNNHNAAGWAVRAWESNDDKITQVR